MRKPLIVKNLAQVVTLDPRFGGSLGIVERGAVVCGQTIEWVGPEAELPPIESSTDILDGHGGVLTPGLVDAHTHLLYGGSRENEFVRRTSGENHERIDALDGGIISTVMATRQASQEELLQIGLARLDSFLARGTTTVEVKSGYGLTTADEFRMLEVIGELNRLHPIDVVPTFMAAHALAPEYADRRADYVELIIQEMIPQVARKELADFCDVFCDEIGFSASETNAILMSAQEHGLRLKVHAEQFSLSGGTDIAIDLAACSADHLDYITPELERNLATSDVVAVLTPGVNFFLGLDHWPPARRLIDSGVDVALATDYSPGACMTENLPLVMTIACVRTRMRPDEVLRAATLTGARAVGRQDTVGSLAVGKRADCVIWAAPTYQHLVYHFGVDHVATVVKDGAIVSAPDHSGCLPH